MMEETPPSFSTSWYYEIEEYQQEQQQRWLLAQTTASELYDQVTFKTDTLFNQPAPEYWVSFIIGGVSFFVMFCII